MNNNEPVVSVDFAHPPTGITLGHDTDGSLTIHHKRTGMGCMNLFLGIFMVVWSCVCGGLLYKYVYSDAKDASASLFFVVAFWFFEIVALLVFVPLLFSKKAFRLSSNDLFVETTLFGLKTKRTVAKGTINIVIQIKDGGVDEDSFPSWGLKLGATKEIVLISRQPYEVSEWLGCYLANWANVPYTAAPWK